jgi:hypothetical protein
MKAFGRFFYLLSSPVEISKDKLRELEEGTSHIHRDPVRSVVKKDNGVQIGSTVSAIAVGPGWLEGRVSIDDEEAK